MKAHHSKLFVLIFQHEFTFTDSENKKASLRNQRKA